MCIVVFCSTQRDLTKDEETYLDLTYSHPYQAPLLSLEEILPHCDIVAVTSPSDPALQKIREINPNFPVIYPCYESHIVGYSTKPKPVFVGWERILH